MKYHKWKYFPILDCMICEKCGIAKMKDRESNQIVYVDLNTDPYFNRNTKQTKRPDCFKSKTQNYEKCNISNWKQKGCKKTKKVCKELQKTNRM